MFFRPRLFKRWKHLISDTEIKGIFSDLSMPTVKYTRQELDFAEKVASTDLTPNLQNITKIIYLNSKTKRPKEAQAAFDYIKEIGLQPDLVAYNNLMAAYSTVDDYDAVKNLFQDLKKSGLKPDLVSHSILICAAGNKSVDLAFEHYENFRKEHEPNLIIFNALITSLIREKQFERAWKTFANAKGREQADSKLYTTMISMCHETQECEKAVDLFQEMMDLGIDADQKTFNALIKACGSRPDYYDYSFELLEKMIVNGFETNMETFEVLMGNVSRYGDINRARIVWNQFQATADLSKHEDGKFYYDRPILPSAYLLSKLNQTYANFLLFGKSVSSTTNAETENTPIEIMPPSQGILPSLPLKSLTRTEIAEETELVWNTTINLVNLNYFKMTGSLLASRVEQLCASTKPTAINDALEFFETEYRKWNIPVKAGVFKTLLRVAMKSKETYELGLEVFDRFLKWEDISEQQMIRNHPSLSLEEKENLRTLEGRSSKTILDCFLIVARGHCRNDKLSESIEVLNAARKFRFPYYLPPIQLGSIHNILQQAQREADNGNLLPLKQIKDICPPVHENMLTLAQSLLQRKFIPQGWWGWKVLMTDQERIQMMKKNKLKNQKMQQIQLHSRRKAALHNENKAKKALVFKGFAE